MPKSIEPRSAEEPIPRTCYFARLEDAALHAGYNVQSLREFCWLVNVHPYLPGFVRVCKHFLEIFSYLDDLTQLGESLISSNAWEPLLRWIVDQRDVLAKKIFSENDQEDNANRRRFLSATPPNPIIQSNITRYGLYGALWTSHPLVQLQKPFRLLQCKVQVAHARIMKHSLPMTDWMADQEPFQGYFAGLYRPSLSVRHFVTGGPEWNAVLDQLEFHQSTESLMMQLLKMAAEISTRSANPADDFDNAEDESEQDLRDDVISAAHPAMSRLENALRTIATFLERGKNPEGYQRRIRQRTGSSSTGSSVVDGAGADDEILMPAMDEDIQIIEIPLGESGGFGGATFYAPQGKSSPSRHHRQAIDAGDHPQESAAAHRLYFAEDEHGVSMLRGGAVEMANQLLPWSINHIAPEEMAVVLKYVDGAATELTPDILEANALLHVMLWLGASLSQAIDLYVLAGGTPTPKINLAVVLPQSFGKSNEKPAKWLVRALDLEYQSSTLPPTTIARPITTHMELPDVIGGSHPVLRYIRYLRDSGRAAQYGSLAVTEEPFRIFQRDVAYYRKKLQDLFRASDSMGRVTTGMISGSLFQRIQAQTGGDMVSAALITRTDHYLASVRRHYATPEVRYLQEIYTRATGAMDAELRQSGFSSRSSSEANHARSATAVGSMLCPTIQAVQDAVTRIRRGLEGFAPHIYSNADSEFCERHNLYTFYCVLAFGFATGVRGVSNPYPHSSQIDWKHGFCVITDKDSGSGYKSRVVWLPVTIRELMLQYRDYLESISDRCELPSATRELPCYFLDPDLRQRKVQPKTMAPFLHEYLPFPANAGRHFLYNQLRERGVSSEIVDSLMGHWWRGEEPWGPFSTLRLQTMCKELEVVLSPLLDELGFGAIALPLDREVQR